jgi:hypothetical protein
VVDRAPVFLPQPDDPAAEMGDHVPRMFDGLCSFHSDQLVNMGIAWSMSA